MKSIYVSTITISGIGGTSAATPAKTANNTTKNAVVANTTVENTATNEVVPAVTEETETDENGFPVGPVVGTVATIAIIGGTAVYVTKFGPSTKTVKDPVTGETKKYHLDKETGQYVSEDGKTILNTEIVDEVAKQAIKDKEFMDREHQKLINRETAFDDLNRQMVKENEQMKKDFEKQQYVEKVAFEHGIRSDEIGDVKKELGQIQEENLKKDEAIKQTAQNWDTAVKTAEVVEEVADIAITVGETAVPGGKTVSAVYKATKSVASSVAKDGFDKGKLANATIKGLADAGTTYMGGLGKAAVTVGAEVGGDVTEAVIEGKSAGEVWETTKEAAIKGTAKATVNATGDALGDVVGTETANVGTYLYQKHVVDPKLDENLKKGKSEK